jgi:hypothetical protein
MVFFWVFGAGDGLGEVQCIYDDIMRRCRPVLNFRWAFEVMILFCMYWRDFSHFGEITTVTMCTVGLLCALESKTVPEVEENTNSSQYLGAC